MEVEGAEAHFTEAYGQLRQCLDVNLRADQCFSLTRDRIRALTTGSRYVTISLRWRPLPRLVGRNSG